MCDPLILDRVRERFLNVLLPDQLAKRLRTVLPRNNLIHEIALRVLGSVLARPRVIRGTRAKSLPLLPSGPGGVYNRPLHEARSLTTFNVSIRCYSGTRKTARNFSPKKVGGVGLISGSRSADF